MARRRPTEEALPMGSAMLSEWNAPEQDVYND